MARHELWRGEASQRYRIMEDMEENRAAREERVLRDANPARSDEAEYRYRLAQQRGTDAEQDHRGRGPRGYRRSDERIAEDLHKQLTDDSAVDAREIEVVVSGGEVSLSGTVDDRVARRRAEDIAESVSGVVHVANHIRIRQPGS